jgi:hypothetical protein
MTLEQRPTPFNPTPAAAAVSEVQRPSRPGLTAEELVALREVWSTPLRPAPVSLAPPVFH